MDSSEIHRESLPSLEKVSCGYITNFCFHLNVTTGFYRTELLDYFLLDILKLEENNLYLKVKDNISIALRGIFLNLITKRNIFEFNNLIRPCLI